jgi:hypothetical protein
MGQADLAAGGEGAVGLAGLLGQQPTALSGIQERLVDLVGVEGAGRDQVVEVAGRLPQLAVALADGGGGDPGQLLGQCCSRVPISRSLADGREFDLAGRSLELGGLEPLQQHRGNLAGLHVQVAPWDPLVGPAADVAAGGGDHIATPAPPIHMLQPDRRDTTALMAK